MEAMTDREQRVDQIRRAHPRVREPGFQAHLDGRPGRGSRCFSTTLYQYFDNRADLFQALQIILVEATDAALAAFEVTASSPSASTATSSGSCRWVRTLYGMAFATEFLEAKHEFAADVSDAELGEYATDCGRSSPTRRRPVPPPVRPPPSSCSSPAGLADWPQPEVYRKRLTTLACPRRCCST